MSEMVERIAKVISGSGVTSKRSLKKARDVLIAMRVPSDDMVALAQYPILYDTNFAGTDPPPHICWERMIDAALGQHECQMDRPKQQFHPSLCQGPAK